MRYDGSPSHFAFTEPSIGNTTAGIMPKNILFFSSIDIGKWIRRHILFFIIHFALRLFGAEAIANEMIVRWLCVWVCADRRSERERWEIKSKSNNSMSRPAGRLPRSRLQKRLWIKYFRSEGHKRKWHTTKIHMFLRSIFAGAAFRCYNIEMPFRWTSVSRITVIRSILSGFVFECYRLHTHAQPKMPHDRWCRFILGHYRNYCHYYSLHTLMATAQ